MILKKLEIELQQWGDKKGQYKGEISFVSIQGEVSINLSPEQLKRILPIVADSIVEAAKETANILTSQVFDQTTAINVLDARDL